MAARSFRPLCFAFLLLASCFLTAAASDDTLWYKTLGVEHGLSQNFVTAMLADRDGFMWFATPSGLDRWNGYDFESYRHDPGRVDSLSAQVVLALHADPAGHVWVGTPRGLDRFDPALNAFRRYGSLFLDARGRPVRVDAITSDRAGRVWFAWYGGPQLYQFDPRTGAGREYAIAGAERKLVSALIVDSADRLWVAMRPNPLNPPPEDASHRLLGFDRCSEITGDTMPGPRTALTLDTTGGNVNQVLEDLAHRLWLARASGGLTRYDPQTGAQARVAVDRSSPQALEGAEVRSLALGPTGEIWVLAVADSAEPADRPHGVHRVDPETLRVRRVELREREVAPGNDAPLKSLAVDRSGVLWLSSDAGGLRYADVSTGGLALYRKEVIGPQVLNSSFVRAVMRDRRGTLWVGTPKGLNRIDESGARVGPRAENIKLPHPYVQALHEDGAGNLWIGTPAGILVREPSGAERRYRHREDDPKSLSGDSVQVVHESRDGRLWIGLLGGGLNEFEPRTRSFKRYPVGPGAGALLGGEIYALHSDTRNSLWIGAATGLWRLDTTPGSQPSFEPIAPGAAGLTGTTVLSIEESPATPGVLWIGTDGRGLCRLDVSSQAVRWFTSRNSALDGDTVNGILADGRGRLWLSTSRGLVCYDPTKDSFLSHSADPGAQSIEFNSRAYFKAPDGKMYFGGVGGLNAFYPDQLVDNPYPPTVLVATVHTSDRGPAGQTVGGRLIYRHGMPQRATDVAYDQRDVTFDYVALHFSDASRNQYFYRLDGFDSGWQGPVTTRSARYTNLSPGAYTFRVKAVSSQGVASLDEAAFSFVIRPPFYATWWFRSLASLAVLLALVVAYRLRVRRLFREHEELEREVARRTEQLKAAAAALERQAQQLKELDSAKSRFFANVSHEFRTPLTLTLGPLRDVQSGLHGQIPPEARDEIDLAIRNTERQLALVDQLMVLARLDAGQLKFHPRRARLDEWLRLVCAPYESHAKRQRARLVVEVPPRPVEAPIDEEKLDRVLGNLLDNAFKFTPSGGTVTVRLTTSDEGWATIVVEDTGSGIPTQDLPHVFERFYRGGQETGPVPGTGIGLALAKECVDLHGGRIEAENRPEGGTRFTVLLPAGAAHLESRGDGADTLTPPDVEDGDVAEHRGDESAAAAGEDATEARGDRTDRATVLIVDDHADMRAYLRKHLEPHYHVLEASRGDDGLAAVRAELPDAIVCDVMMPGMDGYAFCRAVRADPDTDFLPVVLLTARAGPEGRLEGLEGGADDYVTKPFQPAELLARIRNLLHGRERLKARFSTQAAGPVALASPRQLPSVDAVLLEKLRGVLDREAHDEAFDVTALAGGVGMSRAQLHRRVKDAFGSTPAEMIIQYRLERAAQMLAQRAGNVGEIAYASGFRNVSHFVKRFRERYGRTPSAYMDSHRQATEPTGLS